LADRCLHSSRRKALRNSVDMTGVAWLYGAAHTIPASISFFPAPPHIFTTRRRIEPGSTSAFCAPCPHLPRGPVISSDTMRCFSEGWNRAHLLNALAKSPYYGQVLRQSIVKIAMISTHPAEKHAGIQSISQGLLDYMVRRNKPLTQSA